MNREAPTDFRRSRVRWPVVLGAVGAGGVVLAAGIWLFRLPLAEMAVRGALSGRGIESDFQIHDLDFGGASVRSFRLGSERSPDLSVQRLNVRFAWAGPFPRIAAIEAENPHVRLRMDEAGRVSGGALDRLGGGGARKRLQLPAIQIALTGGEASLEGPFGTLVAAFSGQGVLGRDFNGQARIAPTTLPGETYGLEAAQADLAIVSQSNALAFRLTGGADRIIWNGAQADELAIELSGRAPLDLSQATIEGTWTLDALASPTLQARDFAGRVAVEGLAREDALAPRQWSGTVGATATRFGAANLTLTTARFDARGEGESETGALAWTLDAERFNGFALTSAAPSANGQFRYDLHGEEKMTGAAAITLARASMDADAQANVRSYLPDIEGAPFGPPVRVFESALDRGMDNFTLTAPVKFAWEGEQGQFFIDAPIEAQAASGLVVRASPLRNDGPAFAFRMPSSNLHAALSVEVSGGGAPMTSFLLDAADWAPNQAFEADGSLTIAEWRAGNARLAAPELEFSLAQPPQGAGQLTLSGPVSMSGPVGDGRVQEMNLPLDLAIAWENGWRVSARENCLPITMQQLVVAGLDFRNGALSLCGAQNGPLIAANANNQLSGGFVIDGLAFNGRMAGPQAQPARLRSQRVTGAFSGTPEHIVLAVEAAAPSLAIDMARDRTMTVTGQSVQANARIGDNTWRVEGLFNAGLLTDPSLPGDVSAITGRWTAEPVDDRAVIRVAAGEARVEARKPPPSAPDPRPLFQPVRFADVDAVLDRGDVNANGRIVLEDGGRQLATFTAHHDIDAGIGTAHVVAEQLTFDRDLQPFQITELARGLVENVRGPVNATADFRWDDQAVTGTARVQPQLTSLSTSTIPVLTNVGGDIYFDDVFLLTTPPGQTVTIGSLNPGVEVQNGRIRFQLMTEQRVSIEQAEFDFSSGELAVAPTTITLGAEETRFELSLREVDVATLLAQLNFEDLRATGKVEGTFPLLLTRRTAFIENGQLRASEGGGTIAYVGQAGQNATGPAAIAFDALSSFRYDSLTVALNGDISGEVVSEINFVGRNTGDGVQVGDVSPLPGLGGVRVRGVPFLFRVTVRAPFSRLAETAASITDPGSLLDRTRGEQEPNGEDGEVDAPAQPPR